MNFECKAIIAVFVVFFFCLFISSFEISGMQVVGTQGSRQDSQTACVDSDGGMNPSVKGSISYVGDRPVVLEDVCEGDVLIERICAGQNSVRYACQNGCRAGACLPPLRLIKKEIPELNKEMIQIVRQAQEEERRQREEAERARRERERRRQVCNDECNRIANYKRNLCPLTFRPDCERQVNQEKERCVSGC